MGGPIITTFTANKALMKYLAVALVLLAACSSKDSENSSSESTVEINSAEEAFTGKQSLGDSIFYAVPKDWSCASEEAGPCLAWREDSCDEVFCRNLVIYDIDATGFSRFKLAEEFIALTASRVEDFRLVYSEINAPDSTQMSFDYLFSKDNVKLGGTTIILLNGDQGVVFSFAGYDGEEGEYVKARDEFTEILQSIELKY